MEIMKTIKKNGLRAVVGTALMATAVSANAALPQTVKDAIDAAKADGLEAGYLVIGVFAALFVIGIVKRLMK